MPKILTITFSGICTLTPGYPREGEARPTQVFVVMPAARRPMPGAAAGTFIGRHYPFIYVPQANYLLLSNPDRPTPRAFTVYDKTLGVSDVFLLDAHRVELDMTDADTPLQYHRGVDEIGRRPAPGQDKTDIRWVADMREIDPGASLAADADPRQTDSPDREKVAAVVPFTHGVIAARFPCENTAVQVITKADGTELARTFASEFTVTIEYPSFLEFVHLRVRPFVEGGDPHDDLVLYWGGRNRLDIRMGNDTFDELVMLQKNSCALPPGTPQEDRDFELHYRISENINTTSVPRASGNEARHNGCLGVMVGSTSGGGG